MQPQPLAAELRDPQNAQVSRWSTSAPLCNDTDQFMLAPPAPQFLGTHRAMANDLHIIHKVLRSARINLST